MIHLVTIALLTDCEVFMEQLSLFTEIPKAPIYHVSLNHVWEECPTCKAYNKATHDVRGVDGRFYPMRYERCPECNQLFDWSETAVKKATKYSKDYLEHIRMKELQK